MAVTLTITPKDIGASSALARLEASFVDQSELMDSFGRLFVTGANERIGVTNLTPDGAPWPKSRRVERDGGKTLYESGELNRSITSLAGAHQVEVGSNAPYAAVQQLGAAVGSLGFWAGSDKNGRQMSVLSPWGDIPARPYLGVTDEDEKTIAELVSLSLSDALSGGLL